MNRVLLFIFVLALAIGGCASVPQFFPASLEEEPIESLSELKVDLPIEHLRIDGRLAIGRKTYLEPDPIFLAPGEHTLRYWIYGETEQWRSFIESMKSTGYTLSADGKLYVKDVGGVTVTKRADRVERLGWTWVKKEVDLEAGRAYKLSEL